MSAKKSISQALVAAKDQKFTVQDKKLVIDAIKLRYNGMLAALNQATHNAITAGQRGVNPGNFPFTIQTHYMGGFLAGVSPAQRAKAKKIEGLIESLAKEYQKQVEIFNRVARQIRERSGVMETTLIAERDKLIFDVSLLGSSAAAQSIIDSLRSPEDMTAEMAKVGIEIQAEVAQITGIGDKTPKNLSLGE